MRAFVRDISDRKRTEAALRDADRRKDRFLATLAHELRNPLAAVRSATYALGHEARSGDRSKRELSALAIVDRQLNHLNRLVDDLLDVSRITTGNIELRRARVELVEVLQHAVETVQPTIDNKGHAFRIEMSEPPILLDGDAIRLAQVFANLLSNAAKYTDPGGEISLSGERRADKAIITVRDDGIGITPEMLPLVFDLFAQADHRGARTQGGLGVGLGLVKNLVQLHGGTVEARSDGFGRGSTFTVCLPLAE
jgi:signal transduction histidine kinase